MTKLKVLEYPDPRLRTVAVPVEQVDDQIRTLVANMFETMRAESGIGLAATQVDVHKQVIVMDLSANGDQPLCFINPEIVEAKGSAVHQEGCLSVPGVFADVKRAEDIVVKALDENGKPFELSADGLLAVCIQHEMDHLQGKVFVDYLSEMKRQKVQKILRKRRREIAADPEFAKDPGTVTV